MSKQILEGIVTIIEAATEESNDICISYKLENIYPTDMWINVDNKLYKTGDKIKITVEKIVE